MSKKILVLLVVTLAILGLASVAFSSCACSGVGGSSGSYSAGGSSSYYGYGGSSYGYGYAAPQQYKYKSSGQSRKPAKKSKQKPATN